MTQPGFKDGALNRDARKSEPVKKMVHGKEQTIKREPLLRRPYDSQRQEERLASMGMKATHVYHHRNKEK